MKKELLATSLLLAACSTGWAQSEKKDTVKNEPPTYNLDDVVVVGNKPVISTDGAKLTYNVEEDPSTKGSNLLDALRKIPMVSVDGEGNISINGDSNFKILLNGKEDPSINANYKNIFKAMPADMVVKIEVITEPGARYDAEGTGGIINIVTIKKNSTDGYSGHIELSSGNAQNSLNAYLRMRKNRLAMNINANIADNGFMKLKNESFTETENRSSASSFFQTNHGVQNAGFRFSMGSLNLSYDLSEKDLLTAGVSFNGTDVKIDNSRYETSIFDSGKELISELGRNLDGKIDIVSVSTDASWEHAFDGNGRKAILSYRYNHGKSNTDVDFTTLRQSGIISAAPYQGNRNNENSNEHTFQADFINPFSEGKQSLDAGVKGIWRRNNALSTLLIGSSPSDASESHDDRSDLLQFQDVYSIYTSYNGTFGHLTATAGIRYEHTRMGIDFKAGDYDDFTSHLNDVVPNVALAWNLSMMSNLRLSYQMRISRPSLSQVNPYEFSMTTNNVQVGNPDLSSARSNKVGLTYSNFGNKFGGNIGIEYNTIDNAIQFYTYARDGITYMTYANIGHDRNLEFSGLFNWNIRQRMQFMLSARMAHAWLSTHNPDYSNSGWTLNYSANWNYTLPSATKINIYGGQSTRRYNLQGHNNGYYYYGLGVTRDFLKDKSLSVTLSAGNFLQKNRKFTSETITEMYKEKGVYFSRSWMVGLSVGWNFGNLKSDVKKTGTRIINDDTSDVSNKSGNGGI